MTETIQFGSKQIDFRLEYSDRKTLGISVTSDLEVFVKAPVNTSIEKVKENELENAKEIWRKKFKAIPASRDEWARQGRFLQSRGFGFDIIKKVLNSKIEDDN